MSMKYIRDYYGVPAKRGGRIRYTGEVKPVEGTITSAKGPSLKIRMDGTTYSLPFHPTWEIEYISTAVEQ